MDDAKVIELAKLSRIQLDRESVPKIAAHLSQMVRYLEPLRSLDLSEVEPLIDLGQGAGATRADIPQPTLERHRLAMNAPEIDSDHFVIPKVMP